jgi:hypothetical protein
LNLIAAIAESALRWTKSKRHGRTSNIADIDNRVSCAIARSFTERIETQYQLAISEEPLKVEPGTQLQNVIRDWLNTEIQARKLQETLIANCNEPLDHFYQYQHLEELRRLVRDDSTGELEIVLGGEYVVKPDVIVEWKNRPWRDLVIQEKDLIVRESSHRFLHASVSCKWTIRSDRVQNVRLEAANIIRKRRGRPPHFVCVTCEPFPLRLAAVAGGDGDLDCTYHLDLQNLWSAVADLAANDKAFVSHLNKLEILIRARKLRPLIELPQDLLDVTTS